MAQDLLQDSANFTDGVYRAAFPAYRVFIYGKEVTQDVIEVRVNNSGGSLERTPGGCSFTLVNPSDRYIISHSDMKVIANARAVYSDILYSEPTDEEIEFLSTANKTTFYGGLAEETQSLPVKGSTDSATTVNSIKQEVLSSKMNGNTVVKDQKSSSVMKYNQQVIFDYPMQEGDCIFHSNDPVRIVFRDPFDPRIWYWMFSGFVDSFTENKGVNKESTVTITCTDVSKSLRYSIVNIDPGLLDPDVSDVLKNIQNATTTGINLYQELFVGLNIYEILEVLFFGTDSWKKGKQTESINRFINGLSDAELANYIISNVPSYTSDVTSAIDVESYTSSFSDADRKKYRKIAESLMINSGAGLDEVNNSQFKRDIGMVSSPHNVRFKRYSDSVGLSAYYLGNADSSIAGSLNSFAQQLNDLKSWNDIVYHRVRPQDWYDMAVEGYNSTPPPNIADVGYGLDVITNTITAICTDTKNFPVGGGRVFYLTQAQLTEDLGSYVVDQSLASGSVIAHSTFLDRLTLLYDLSDRVDFFRFYATPRGDLVFELAFYDYDPEQFTNTNTISTEYDPASFMLSHQDIFNEAYAGRYSTEEAQLLTSQDLTIQGAITGYTPINWSNQPAIDYLKEATIEPYEQISYSNTNTDDGVVNIGVSVKNTYGAISSLSDSNMFTSKCAVAQGLIPLLGARLWKADILTWIDTDEGAEIYAGLGMRRRNAEMRNISITTVPKFGTMVNRPILWKYRNCSANVVSVAHSIVWNNDCSSTVNINSVRGWSGKIDSSGRMVREYFGGDYPFNPSEFVKKAINQKNKGTGKADG
jgi:hypothetical protein